MSMPPMNQFTPPGQHKSKFTPELRILTASVLSMAVILLWAKYFGPKPPANQPQQKPAAATAPATPGTASQAAPTAASAVPATMTAAAPTTTLPVAEAQERKLIVESPLYRVELSNRGGTARSWQLKKYTDDSHPPKLLDLVHPAASQQTGNWPLAIVLGEPELQKLANTGIYKISTDAASLTAPADVTFTWSDGHLEISKKLHFVDTYVVDVETSAHLDGKPILAGLAWLGGFGDPTVTNPVPVETVQTYYSENGKLSSFLHKKLENGDKVGTSWQGGKSFAGIEDRYFTAAFLPPSNQLSEPLETRYWKNFYTTQYEGKDISEAIPEVAVATNAQPMNVRVYVGPKDYDVLKAMRPPLNSLVQFGWLEIIAEPLFHILKWLHNYIPNWGWAIVVLTIIINIVLFPLRISSYRTTLKMQRVAPEIKLINDKYKKYKMNDPRMAEKNKEIMALYSREGINPVGGCFQMFLQMPIWFGLNTVLRNSIELRHAGWLWIHDLASKDPYYILPVAVGVSMYLVSKMTPMTVTDPQQAQLMKIMPISFAVMFVIFPFSSGLALYILTSSLVGILQQWYLNRTHPLPVQPKPVRVKK